MTARLLFGAAVGLLAFGTLGAWVTHHALSRFDLLGSAGRGVNVPLATLLTISGYGLPLTLLAVLTIGVPLLLRLPPTIPVAIVISQILAQWVADVLKGIFARSRPQAWLFRHEPGFSYPSGHATTAIVFYGAWALVLWNCAAPLPLRAGGSAFLVLWAFGIGWSRVTLGAHYATDVLGGYLFGLSWLCLALVVAASCNGGFASRHT